MAQELAAGGRRLQHGARRSAGLARQGMGDRRFAMVMLWGLVLDTGGSSPVEPRPEPLPDLPPVPGAGLEKPGGYMPTIRLNPGRPVRPGSQVRVRIFPHERHYAPHFRDKIKDRVTIRSKKPCNLYRGQTRRAAGTVEKLDRDTSFSWRAADLDHPLWLNCPAPATLVRKGGPSWSYAGKFYIRRSGRSLEVINVVGLSTYLKGVVPSEAYAGWPFEALKTQAVAARTYAAFHLSASRLRGERFMDVDDTIAWQVYTGLSRVNPRTNRAIRETRGEILTWGDSVIRAYYHADSGGHTEFSGNVWNVEAPYLVARMEKYENGLVDNPEWRMHARVGRLARWLRARRLIPASSRVENIVVQDSDRTLSGRVRHVTVLLRDGGTRSVPVDQFKRFFRRRSLPSTLFSLENNIKGVLTVKGRGRGHGVGLNQKGASVLAGVKGWDYRQILGFYYNGTGLCTLARKKAGATDPCYSRSGSG